MATTTTSVPSSMTTINNMALEPSTMVETTTTETANSSSSGEETTTTTDPGFLITTNMAEPVSSSKAANIDTNKDTIPSIDRAKETGLFLEPGWVTHGPSSSYNSYLSPGQTVSDIYIYWVIQEIEYIEKMENTAENTVIKMIETMTM